MTMKGLRPTSFHLLQYLFSFFERVYLDVNKWLSRIIIPSLSILDKSEINKWINQAYLY